MSTFSVKPKVYFGVGELKALREMNCKNAFIVTDPFMVKSGAINKVTEQLELGSINYEVFSEIVPDPPLETVAKGIKSMDKFSPDAVIAMGGGSAIDAAKAITHFRGLVKSGTTGVAVEKPMFIAIPTTSGTGSEVTAFSVITDKQLNVKYPLVEEDMLPDAAILDAELVKSVPASITADTGIDVLTHAIEAYVSTEASDFTDALAEKAIKLVFKYLPIAYKEGANLEAREKMHNASCIAGMAFTNSSLGINHSMAHIIGGRFHVPHGKANALVLPYVIEYNADIKISSNREYTKAAERYAEIARFLGLTTSNNPREGVRSLLNAVKNLIKTVGIPNRLKDLEISLADFEANVDEMAQIAKDDACTVTNPRNPEVTELRDLFCKVYNGR
ncbi:Alcohol dehydrogenase, class IV [Clostridium collagenovorans DSM 3089]|uniref:Alcohol dehydrogenase, class IV n=1 Tax=Clostridium collagenovorans DSM 3089 TaxID=1121306 RepID=A0A1M5TBJ4_9CLOT|nr:1-propanol dehydrogenase PduQ [Clostridium collagenovorans]SHH48089.1 Alcohol dehydrogenase, class IV [Clostridium collagenovorans DSM 3089]